MTEPARVSPAGAAPVHVGRIEFVNCFPLYHHFAGELATRGVSADIVEGYPAALNDMLADVLIVNVNEAAGEVPVVEPGSVIRK